MKANVVGVAPAMFTAAVRVRQREEALFAIPAEAETIGG